MFFKHNAIVISIAVLFLSLATLSHAQNWNQLLPTGSLPTSRYLHTAVYDAPKNQMTIFGGFTFDGNILNDVWVLSHANGLDTTTSAWTQIFPSGSAPTTRYLQTAISDTVNNIMTIYGGYDGTSILGDIWTLSNANGLDTTTPTWTQMFPGGSIQSTRASHSSVYDSANNIMIVFGGTNNNVVFNDVWLLTHANGLGGTPLWSQIFPAGSPPTPRVAHSAIYDAVNNSMTIFAGSTSITADYFNDVWILSHANGTGGTPTWAQVFPAGSPPAARNLHTAVYDTTNNIMTIFAGASGDTTNPFLNDLFELSHANGLGGTPTWSQIFPSETLQINVRVLSPLTI